MREAYLRLRQDDKSILYGAREEELQIEVTDYYVRFLPKDDFEMAILSEQDSLVLSDFPLDYEIEEGVAGAYHDPTVAKDRITWQYTVVPRDYMFRDMEYEILAVLFLQEDEEEVGGKTAVNRLKRQLVGIQWRELENEAFRITANEEYVEEWNKEDKGEAARKSWYPSGRIMYEDNTTGEILPIAGVKVMVKRWFKVKEAITNSQGYFYVSKFKSKKVKCGIKWESGDWDIRSGSYGQAWYSYETLKRGDQWRKTIMKSGTPLNWLYASVHRGAREYMYGHYRYGIRKPNANGGPGAKIRIGVRDKSGRAHYFSFNSLVGSAEVLIYSREKSGKVLDSRDLFATAVHELAHVSHWDLGYTNAEFAASAVGKPNDPRLPESWAVGVEYTVTNAYYPDRGYWKYDFPYEFNLQNLTLEDIEDQKGYTPIVIDMIDDYNQSERDKKGEEYPNDRASGYTLGQLEDALPRGFGGWWKWKSRIQDKFDNPTEGEELDYLFSEYH
ncbi:hypothetical protein [Echinicola strongylocentroti]|nr:hypothetical protein [Echinicola strongylocentroti]